MGTGTFVELILLHSPDSSLTFYTFNKRDIERTSWEIIAKENIYKKTKFKLTSIKESNWHLSIP